MIDFLTFLLSMAGLAGLLYGMACFVQGGRPRCGECGCLIAPWDAYCLEHAP